MGGDQESSVQEASRGKTILADRSASVRQVEIAIDRELESHDTERDDELHRVRVHPWNLCGKQVGSGATFDWEPHTSELSDDQHEQENNTDHMQQPDTDISGLRRWQV